MIKTYPLLISHGRKAFRWFFTFRNIQPPMGDETETFSRWWGEHSDDQKTHIRIPCLSRITSIIIHHPSGGFLSHEGSAAPPLMEPSSPESYFCHAATDAQSQPRHRLKPRDSDRAKARDSSNKNGGFNLIQPAKMVVYNYLYGMKFSGGRPYGILNAIYVFWGYFFFMLWNLSHVLTKRHGYNLIQSITTGETLA